MFAQMGIKVDVVSKELELARAATGSAKVVEEFVLTGLQAHGAAITASNGRYRIDLSEVPCALRDQLPPGESFQARFDLPVGDNEWYLGRTHPVTEGLASYMMDTALDPIEEGVARRAGAIRTDQVDQRTTLLLVRYRYDLVTAHGGRERSQLAEECRLLAFQGSPEQAKWLEPEAAEALLLAEPKDNIMPEQARDFVGRVVDDYGHLKTHLESEADRFADELLQSHQRIRSAAKLKGVKHTVRPQLPPDVLGIYVLLPARTS